MMVTKSKIPVWRLAGFALQRGGCYRIDLPDIGYAYFVHNRATQCR